MATGIDDISRNDRLRLLGNGVIPAQAAAAYLTLAQRALTDAAPSEADSEAA